jgi:toxin CptA
VRSRLQGQILLGLGLANWLVVGSWLQASSLTDWRQVLAIVATGCAGLAGYYSWKNSALGQIAWDGQLWRWESPGYQRGVAEQTLSVLADFQHVLLLRLENKAHASLWLWVERKTAPERWMDLRRAVYSPQRLPGHAPTVNETPPSP